MKLNLVAADPIEASIAQINKDFGIGSLVRADQATGLTISHISTGCYALDIALGGGIAESRLSQLFGPFSSFKSTAALCTIANFQRKYIKEKGRAVYMDLEHTLHRGYCQKLGVDLTRLYILNPDDGEQAHELLQAVLKWECPLLGIVDSIPGLIPTKQLDDPEDKSMALQARLVNKIISVANARMKRSLCDTKWPKTTLLFMNQIREKPGVTFGSPEYLPGGRGKEFFYSVSVRLATSASHAIKEDREVNGVKRSVRVGQEVTFSVQKNKCGGSQYEEGAFEFYFQPHNGYPAYSFNNGEALFNYGAFYKLIELKNGRYYYEDLSAANKKKFIALLQKSGSMYEKSLYQGILQAQATEFYGEATVEV